MYLINLAYEVDIVVSVGSLIDFHNVHGEGLVGKITKLIVSKGVGAVGPEGFIGNSMHPGLFVLSQEAQVGGSVLG